MLSESRVPACSQTSTICDVPRGLSTIAGSPSPLRRPPFIPTRPSAGDWTRLTEAIVSESPLAVKFITVAVNGGTDEAAIARYDRRANPLARQAADRRRNTSWSMHCSRIIRSPAFPASPNSRKARGQHANGIAARQETGLFRISRRSRRHCRDELSAQLQNPIARHDRWSSEAPEEHILNRFAGAALDNLRVSIKRLDHREFDRIAESAGATAPCQSTSSAAASRGHWPSIFHTHLGMVRPGVSLMPGMPALWPQYLLNMDKDSLLVVFDVRRYDRADPGTRQACGMRAAPRSS